MNMQQQMSQVYERFLEANRPTDHAHLKASGQLTSVLQEAGQRGFDLFESYRAALLAQDPPPKDYVAKVQHLMGLESRARELAIAELVDLPPLDQPDPAAPKDSEAVLSPDLPSLEVPSPPRTSPPSTTTTR